MSMLPATWGPPSIRRSRLSSHRGTFNARNLSAELRKREHVDWQMKFSPPIMRHSEAASNATREATREATRNVTWILT